MLVILIKILLNAFLISILRVGSRPYYLYHMIQRFNERNCNPYRSLERKIFEFLILFAGKISSLFFRKSLVWISANLEDNSILSSAYFFAREFQEKNNNTEDEIINPSGDLGISLGKTFLCLDLYFIVNVL